MNDKQIKDLAAAYGVYARMVEMAKTHYGEDSIAYKSIKTRTTRIVRNALGCEFELAKWAYEVQQGKRSDLYVEAVNAQA